MPTAAINIDLALKSISAQESEQQETISVTDT